MERVTSASVAMLSTKILLLLCAVLLVQETTSLTTLEFLRDLKKKIFAPNDAPSSSQEHHTQCSGLDLNGTCLQKVITASDAYEDDVNITHPLDNSMIPETYDDQQLTLVNFSNSEVINNTTYSETDVQFQTNESGPETTDFTNYTQYYDEQQWNNNFVNDSVIKDQISNNESCSSIMNYTQTETSKVTRQKRGVENTTVNLKINSAENQIALNTTVFTSRRENSTSNKIYNLTGRDENLKNQTEIASGMNTLNNNSNNSSTTKDTEDNSQSEEMSPEDSLSINKMDNNTATDITMKEIGQDTIINTDATNDEMGLVIGNLSINETITPDPTQLNNIASVKEENMSKPLQTKNGNKLTCAESNNFTGTESIDIYNFNNYNVGKHYDAGTNKTENVLSESKGDQNNNIITHIYVQDNDTISKNGSDDLNTAVKTENSTQDDVNNTSSIESQLGKMVKNVKEIIKNTCSDVQTNLTKLESVLINSTQILEQVFQNISHEFSTLGHEINTMKTKIPTEETTNASIQFINDLRSKNLTESSSRNDLVDTPDITADQHKEPSNGTSNNDINTTYNTDTAIIHSGNGNHTLFSLNVTNKDEKYENNSLKLNKSDSNSNESSYLMNNSQQKNNDTRAEIELGTIPQNRRKKRSITLIIDSGEDTETDGEMVITEDMALPDQVYNSTTINSVLWNETTKMGVTGTFCLDQLQQCTNSTDCCKPFVCVTPDQTNSMSYCDFTPSEPILPMPLPNTMNTSCKTEIAP